MNPGPFNIQYSDIAKVKQESMHAFDIRISGLIIKHEISCPYDFSDDAECCWLPSDKHDIDIFAHI